MGQTNNRLLSKIASKVKNHAQASSVTAAASAHSYRIIQIQQHCSQKAPREKAAPIRTKVASALVGHRRVSRCGARSCNGAVV